MTNTKLVEAVKEFIKDYPMSKIETLVDIDNEIGIASREIVAEFQKRNKRFFKRGAKVSERVRKVQLKRWNREYPKRALKALDRERDEFQRGWTDYLESLRNSYVEEDYFIDSEGRYDVESDGFEEYYKEEQERYQGMLERAS